jgi:hypothetical protein
MKKRLVLIAALMMSKLTIIGCGGTPPPATPTVSPPAPEPETKGGKRDKEPKAMLGPEGVVQ